MNRVVKSAQTALPNDEFQQIDFHRAVLTYDDTSSTAILRLGMLGKDFGNEFLLLKTDVEGNIKKGRIVSISGQISSTREFNGTIRLNDLSGKEIINSAITNGRVIAFRAQTNQSMDQKAIAPVYPDPYITLPEVVIVATYSSGGISPSTWYLLESFFNDYGSGGGGTGTYSSSSPFTGGGSGGGTGGGVGTGGTSKPPVHDNPITVDYESQYNDPAIELEKYMKCFSDIPDVGAVGSIEIFADIPVDGDPTKFFNWSNGSPGHTFIQLSKSNGTKFVSQYIGFYPKSGWKTTLTYAPIPGKWVDNHGHEFNASYKVQLTGAQVTRAVNEILYLGRFEKYDIDEYNCTDWALEVFNETVSVQQHLDIPKYDIPGGMAADGTSTPNGLYIKLQQMKKAGGAAASGIEIPQIGYAGESTGPCN